MSKAKLVRGALEGIINLAGFRKEKEMRSASGDINREISRRMDEQLQKISDYDWNFEVGDKVITEDEVARAASPIPWEITGKTIREKGLLAESSPREGKFMYGANVPYYTVQRGTGDSFEQTALPEWAIVKKFGIDKKGALGGLVDE